MSQNIYQKISSIMDEIGAIGKNNRNSAQGFNFRGIDDVYNALHPLLTKYKVFTVPEILESTIVEKPSKSGGTLFYTRLKIKYTFYTDDGSSFTSVVMGEAMDSGDKGANKAMSIAHKYCLLQVFAIPTQETAEPDRESHKVKAVSVATPAKPSVKVDPDSAKLDVKIHESLTKWMPNFEGMTWKQAAQHDASQFLAWVEKLVSWQKTQPVSKYTAGKMEIYKLASEYGLELARKGEPDEIPF